MVLLREQCPKLLDGQSGLVDDRLQRLDVERHTTVMRDRHVPALGRMPILAVASTARLNVPAVLHDRPLGLPGRYSRQLGHILLLAPQRALFGRSVPRSEEVLGRMLVGFIFFGDGQLPAIGWTLPVPRRRAAPTSLDP